MQLVAGRCIQGLGGKATGAIVAALDGRFAERPACCWTRARARRVTPAALPAVVRPPRCERAEVRTAAIGALRYLGDGSTVEAIVKAAAKSAGPERDAARESLSGCGAKTSMRRSSG